MFDGGGQSGFCFLGFWKRKIISPYWWQNAVSVLYFYTSAHSSQAVTHNLWSKSLPPLKRFLLLVVAVSVHGTRHGNVDLWNPVTIPIPMPFSMPTLLDRFPWVCPCRTNHPNFYFVSIWNCLCLVAHIWKYRERKWLFIQDLWVTFLWAKIDQTN